MKYTISELTHTPKVGAIDANGTMHYELDITEDCISLYPTAYNASNGIIQRVLDAEPIFTYSYNTCLLYTSPSPRDGLLSRMPSSA